MSEQQLILNDAFWKFLVSLEELKEKKDLLLFCDGLAIEPHMLLEFQKFLSRFDVTCTFDNDFIYPLKEKCRINVEFTLSEWFALQASFNQKAKEEGGLKFYFDKIIENKLKSARAAFEQYNLYKRPPLAHVEPIEFDNLKRKMDFNICKKRTTRLHFYNEKECVVYPHRLVYLDGVLCIIGENVKDRTLAFFGLEDIKSLEPYEMSYEPNLSQIEVNEFICHVRMINGKEERLVLKVYSQYEADLLPSYHFLGNPFVTSNTEGDMIWAATLEMCDDLFNWLYNMRDRVEVLDPGYIKKEFALYCEMRKDGLKKAS